MTTFRSHVQYRVPYADTDRMGVIYYANYLVYFERSRNQALDDLGMPYARLEADGLMLPVIEAHVNYKQSAGYDDVLDIYGWVSDWSGPRIRMDCEVHCNSRLLAGGYTVHALVRRETGRPVRMPADLRELLQSAVSGASRKSSRTLEC